MASPTDIISSDLFEDDEPSLHSSQDELCISRFEVVLPHSQSSLPSSFLHIDDARGDQASGHLSQNTGNDDRKSDAHVDDELQRRSKRRRSSSFITISHKRCTWLEEVGLQLWRGALLLADYLLSRGEEFWRGRTAVELGAGVGFLGVLLALVPCRRVFLTDMSASMAQLMEKNLSTNDHIHSLHAVGSRVPDVRTRVLDWRRESSWNCRSTCTPAPRPPVCDGEWGWTAEDRRLLCGEDVLWLAADVIYDDEVTEQFFRLLASLMRPGERLLLALEKRFNFEVRTLSLVPHGYELFRRYVNVGESCPRNCDHLGRGIADSDCVPWSCEDMPMRAISASQQQRSEGGKQTESMQTAFTGALVPLDFPQAVLGYDRGEDLELWSIALCEV